MISSAIQRFVTANGTAVNVLLGTRMYPLVLPAKPTPSRPPRTSRFRALASKPTMDPPGLNTVRLQIESWADTKLLAEACAAAFEAMLDGFTGKADVADVVNIWLNNKNELFDSGTRLYGYHQDWMIQYRAG